MSKREEEKKNQEGESKVINKGGARLIVSGGDDDQVQRQEPRKIVVEPRVMGSSPKSAGLLDVQEPREDVARLERSVSPGKERVKVDKVKFEKLEDRPDEAEVQEAQWGESFAAGGGRMLFIGGLVVIFLVVGLVVLRGFFDSQTAKVELVPVSSRIEKEDPYEGSPEKWFRDRSGGISEDALIVLKGFLNAENNQARSQWVRKPERYLKLLKNGSDKIDPLLSSQDLQKWEIGHTENTAYLILNARDHEYQPFRAYFTHDQSGLKLDWEATVAWSEVSLQAIRKSGQKFGGPINEVQRNAGVVALSQISPSVKSDLPEKIQTESVFVRCKIRKKEEFYAGPYNDQDHSAYMLLSKNQMHEMWGYVAKGSELDLKLKAILDHGSFVVSLKKDERVTLRVRMSQKDALPSQLELVELVNREWVTPDK